MKNTNFAVFHMETICQKNGTSAINTNNLEHLMKGGVLEMRKVVSHNLEEG